MAFGFGFNKNDSKSSSEFDQNVWEGQAPFLQNMYGQFGNLFNQSQGNQNYGGLNSSMTGGLANQIGGGVYQNMGLQNSLMDSLNASQNAPSASQDIYSSIMSGGGNTSLGNYQNSILDQGDEMKRRNMGLTDARAAAAGMSGGSSHGTANAQMMQNVDRNTQAAIGQLGYGAFDKDLDRKLDIASMADSNTFNRQQLMSGMLNNQQQAQMGGLNAGMNYQNFMGMMPWMQAGAYSQAMGQPQILSSGSSSGKQSGMGISGQYGK